MQADPVVGWSQEEPVPEEEGRRKGKGLENGYGPARAEIEGLEAALRLARESESSMLDSLVSQTKQLEETKIELEEAKLEIRTLLEAARELEEEGCTREEMERLRREVRLAVEAEEKSKKAMDDLAAALREVALEAKDARERLAAMETQYRSARAEADHTMSMLREADGRVRAATEDGRREREDAEAAAARWRVKEEGFGDCLRSFEIEIGRLRQCNEELRASQRSSREEVSKLRDIMKQAVNEATVVKEALEIARAENSRLQDAVAEKEEELQRARQELECIRVSEAAALASVEELKDLLAATSGVCAAEAKEVFAEPEEERIDERVGGGWGYGSFRMPPLAPKAKHRKYASMGSVSMRKAAGSTEGSSLDLNGEEMHSAWGSPERQRKKKAMLRRLGDMLRRSFRKH